MLHAVCDYDPTLNIFNTSCLLGSPICVYFNYAIYYLIIDNLDTTSSQAQKHVIITFLSSYGPSLKFPEGVQKISWCLF